MPGYFCPTCRSLMRRRGLTLTCPKCGRIKVLDEEDAGRSPRSDQVVAAKAERRAPGSAELVMEQGKGGPLPRFFPYAPRKNQQEMMSLVCRSMMTGDSAVIESGTGSGKTVCALAGALEYCIPNDKKIVYITRTNSQAKQVMVELRAINRKTRVRGVALQGRRHGCLMVRHGGAKEVDAADLAKFCEQRKARTLKAQDGGCSYYANFIALDSHVFLDYCQRALPTAEEFVEFCEERGACPYEAMKDLTSQADVIVAPYPYIISPDIRDNFYQSVNLDPKQSVIIVDEAHNLIDFAREAESFEIETTLADAVDKECRATGSFKVAPKLEVRDLCSVLIDAIAAAAQKAREKNVRELKVSNDYLETFLAEKLDVEAGGLSAIAERMMTRGEAIVQERLKKDEAPVSATLALGDALFRWTQAIPSRFVKYAHDGLPPSIRAYCLDPSASLRAFSDCHASVHMSGTLRPLEQYADLVDLPKAVKVAYDSPFPKENRLVLYAEDVTTEYSARKDEGNLLRMEEHMVSLVRNVRRRTMVIFPSYDLMRSFVERDLVRKLGVKVFREEQKLSQDSLMRMVEDFKSHRPKGVLMATAQGRVSEGLDFPDEELEMVIIVGIPYAPPSVSNDALKTWCQTRFGEWKGIEYAVKVPAYRKMAQAIGRLIRSETDIGAAVILDKRAKQFAAYMPMRPSKDPTQDVVDFFSMSSHR